MNSIFDDAVVGKIQFVVHRIRPVAYGFNDLTNPHCFILVLSEAGRAWYECAGEKVEAVPGTLFFFEPGLKHSVHSDAEALWSFFSIGFQLTQINSSVSKAFTDIPWHAQAPVTESKLADFARLERTWLMQEPGFMLAARGLVMQLMQTYLLTAIHNTKRTPHEVNINRLIAEMQRDPTRTRRVSELARQLNLSSSRFRHLFAQHTGCGVTRFQNRIRLRAAQNLLLSGHCNVSEAAAQTGFEDLFYFSRLFKQEMGYPPSSCRK